MNEKHWIVSPRQQQIVDLMAEGLTYEQIGKRLGISWRTVGNQIYRAKIKRRWMAHGNRVLRGKLTISQIDLLKLLAKGFNRKEIAGIMKVSEKTVAFYWCEIQRRLQTKSNFVVALLAREAGIV